MAVENGGPQLYLALKTQRLLAVVVALLMLGQTALTLIQPWPIQRIVDHVVNNPTHGHDLAVEYNLSQFIVSTIERFINANFP
jgi:ABC-type multidrug transport system fused ATPase/permease subunit